MADHKTEQGEKMKIDIPTKAMVKEMVGRAVRIENNRTSKILDRFRKRLIEIEKKIKEMQQ